ncbi:hypothetical protein [Pseudoalteromonas byunsanensis]|uniref:Right handed beta helix domain-containing protein n=1 Tax=Pseudoalteromonas byunsanensis TaxID=327939 RepID=A0A1S1N136_9GAMM|nr:hypothetical protein [Pseudoalteromonas byunsanensis]OHU93388.1 hypothetical protein BIW53_18675 [Pseudoalteromonas byunsanensis]
MIKSILKTLAILSIVVASPFGAASTIWTEKCDNESDLTYSESANTPAAKGCIYLIKNNKVKLSDNELVPAINAAVAAHYRLIIIPKKNDNNNEPYIVTETIKVPRYPLYSDEMKIGNVSIVGEYYAEFIKSEHFGGSATKWKDMSDSEKENKLVAIKLNRDTGYLFDSEVKTSSDSESTQLNDFNTKGFTLKGLKLSNEACGGEGCGILKYRGNFSTIEHNVFDIPNGECINHHIFIDDTAEENVAEGINSKIINNDFDCKYVLKSNVPNTCKKEIRSEKFIRICNTPSDTFFVGNKVTCTAGATGDSCIKLYGWSGALVKNNKFTLSMNGNCDNKSTYFFNAHKEGSLQIVDNEFSYDTTCSTSRNRLSDNHLGRCDVGAKVTPIAYIEQGSVHKITGNTFPGVSTPSIGMTENAAVHLSRTTLCKTK